MALMTVFPPWVFSNSKIRKDAGYHFIGSAPVVERGDYMGQIVGTQATLNVLTGERYKVITTETPIHCPDDADVLSDERTCVGVS